MRNLPGSEQDEGLPQLPGRVPIEAYLPPSRGIWPYLVPTILVIVMMAGVFILAYGIGVDRGKRSANEEREAFYLDRIAHVTGSGDAGGNQLIARVDKIENGKVTAILLTPSGSPTGVSFTLTLGQPSQVYKSDDAQQSDLHTGDRIIFSGDKTGDSYTARTVLILPPAG